MFIDQHDQDKIEKLLTSEPFEWHYNQTTVEKYLLTDDPKSYDTVQFTHVFWHNGAPQTPKHNYSVLEPILEKINYKELIKIKANLLLPHHDPKQYHVPHWDVDEPGYTSLVYYVNDSDGDTILFDKYYDDEYKDFKIIHRETPRKGNAIKFDSDRYHSSNNPTKNQSRIVLNFVYKG